MKKIRYNNKIFYLLLSLFLLLGIGSTTYAANDDPGAGRLSGDHIPDTFYDTDNKSDSNQDKLPFLRRYGSSTSISPYTNKTYTHHSTFDGRTIINGIDVSQWQASIDWNKVKAAGIDFAFIRMGYRGYGSAGTLNKDTYYDRNMQGAAAAGIRTGIYIFSQAITPAEAKAEAQYILNNIGSYNVTMPLILDYEYASTESGLGGRLYNAKLSKKQATDVCLAFCETIAAAGYTPMVYANKSMLEGQLNAVDLTQRGYRIWLANYTTNTTYGGTFDFWQYSSTGKVNGISGNVDMNFYYAKSTDNFFKGNPVIPPVSTNRYNISSASVSTVPSQAYTGKNITPALTITYAGQTLKRDVDYSVAYSKNKNIGTGSIKITGKGNFNGTKTVTFKIVPKTMSKPKAKKRSTNYITLSWSKNTSGSGYQIFRSTSLNGSYKRIKTISKNSTTSYKNTKLTAGQCYYYKIRSYKKVGKTTYYGEFSPVSALYTKIGYTRNALAKSGAAIYNTASSTGSVIAVPAVNASMSVAYQTKDADNGNWYYVTCKINGNSYKGFIPASKVTITKVGKITKASKVNLRKSYSTKSKVITTLNRNQKVTILSTKKKKGTTWYKVTLKKKKKTYNGWISSPYIKIQ